MSKVRFSAQRLSQLMDGLGLNPYDLADLSGVSRTMIHYLREGKRRKASAEIVTKLANALNVTVADLMEDGDAPTEDAPKIADAVRQLARIAGKLSAARQEELLRIATALQKLEQEQEQTQRPLPNGSMVILLDIHKQLREQGADESILNALEVLLGTTDD